MGQGSALYRIDVELSDVDLGVYESLSVRIALHPSEDRPRLAARTLAYCLAYEQGIAFGRGLNEPDDPALFVTDAQGNLSHWIDVGYPSADRLHKVSKAAPRFTVVCHKPAEGLIREREKRAVHGADAIAVWLLAPDMVHALGEALDRSTRWTLVRTGEDLLVNVDERCFAGTLIQTTLAAL